MPHQYRELCLLKDKLLSLDIKYNQIYDFFTLPFFTLNTEFFINKINIQGAHFLHLNRKIALKRNFLSFMPIDQHLAFKQHVSSIYESKVNKSFVTELIIKKSIRAIVNLHCVYLSADKILIVAIDITKEKYLELNNIESHKKLFLFENLFQGSADAMAALDANLYFITMNKAFMDSFSKIFAARVAVNTNLLLVLADFPDLKDQILNAYTKAMLGEKNEVILENNTRKIDAYYCYELFFDPLLDEKKEKEFGVILTIKNISEHRQKQRKRLGQHAIVAHADKKTAIIEMATALAHEINQPLAAINIYSHSCLQNFKKQPNPDEKILYALEQILGLSKHAGDILHRMKNFMRYGELCVEETDLNLLIKNSMLFLEHQKNDLNFNIELNLIEPIPLIYLDKVKITQVILNLAQNSIEAFNKLDPSLLKISIESELRDNFIEINFKDNGPGIPAEVCNKIMQSYFSTKESTGLGLHICRNLIQAHGGKLDILKSTNGAHISFTLPLVISSAVIGL